ncbi:MAG: hypothetical protein M1834_008418 [Cirrosporium novae-zelandiae]|nr:MAG: hypothetical protein M1834_008418 [Cirrosporium novae-zelandiae]
MKFTLALLALAGSAFSYTQPKGDSPTGNPIHAPGLNAIVPAGAAYTITWTATETANNITLLLLRGPSTNCVPIATIVENIENSGSYIWTPSTSLEPDTTHYGIELIVENTGAYQYSTQFGISNDKYNETSSSSASSSTGSTKTAISTGTAVGTITATGTGVASTGMAVSNSSIIQPTISMSVPATLQTSASATGSATGTSTAAATGAAGHMAIPAAGLFAVGIAAMML